MLSEGTHTILMEKNRMLLLRTVQQFLEEEPPHGYGDAIGVTNAQAGNAETSTTSEARLGPQVLG